MNTLKTCLTLALSSLALVACCAEPEPVPPPAPAAAPAPPPKPVACKWPTKGSGDATTAWTNMAYPTGDARTSAVGIEKGMPREARANQAFDFWIVVTNITGTTLDNVVLTEEFGSDFNYQSASPAGMQSGRTVRWDVGTLGPCESKAITVKAVATKTGTVTTCSSVTYSSTLCMGVPIVQPSLLVTLNGPQEIGFCDVATYNIEVTNNGSGAARNVRVKHHLPASMAAEISEFVAGDLAPGQKKAFQVVAKPQKTGQHIHKSSASGEGGLAHETTTITTIVKKPELKITRIAPEMRYLGREIDVEITVENVGDGVAQNTVIEDIIGPHGRFVSASDGGIATGNRVVWNLGNLAPAQKKTVKVTYATTSMNDHEGTTSVVAVCADPVKNLSKTIVQGIPGMLLNGWDDPDPIELGKTTTYTMKVTNQGSAPLTQVQFWCLLDEEDSMEFVSGSNDVGGVGTLNGRRISFPNVPTLAPGGVVTYTVVVKAVKVKQASFTAEAKSAEITRVLQKIETTNFYR
ncbi:MAG: DUF11 domain-containing protein [Phycisphaeraceae bacterium]|nr:DUF11 domain-containing protein [Phycisphaeraceae bacterium]